MGYKRKSAESKTWKFDLCKDVEHFPKPRWLHCPQRADFQFNKKSTRTYSDLFSYL